MSNLEQHAARELRLAGLYDDDADYNGAIAPAVMELIRVFDSQEHSGMSGSLVTALFERLVRFQTLTPPTDDSNEWTEVADKLWQNKRDGTFFSRTGGKTWYSTFDPSLDNGDSWDNE